MDEIQLKELDDISKYDFINIRGLTNVKNKQIITLNKLFILIILIEPFNIMMIINQIN